MSAAASVWDLCNKFTKHMPTYKTTGVSQLYFLKWIAYRDWEQNKHGELSHIYLWCILPVCIFLKLRVSKILDKHICKKILKSLNYIVTLNKMSMTYLDWTQGLDFSFSIFLWERLCNHGGYRWIIMLEKYGHPDLNVFHLKWIIGTHGNWNNQNPGGRFGATS